MAKHLFWYRQSSIYLCLNIIIVLYCEIVAHESILFNTSYFPTVLYGSAKNSSRTLLLKIILMECTVLVLVLQCSGYPPDLNNDPTEQIPRFFIVFSYHCCHGNLTQMFVGPKIYTENLESIPFFSFWKICSPLGGVWQMRQSYPASSFTRVMQGSITHGSLFRQQPMHSWSGSFRNACDVRTDHLMGPFIAEQGLGSHQLSHFIAKFVWEALTKFWLTTS